MTAKLPTLTPAQSTELTAFLRALERRAAVFAELACGDPARGDAALGAAMRAYRNAFARGPVAEPATTFWSLLVAAPALRNRDGTARWPAVLTGLAALGQGSRTAMLLRLVAGLDDAQAAVALRVPAATLQAAVERAIAMPAGGPRGPFWDALARSVEHAIQHLPAERLLRLAALRERAVHGSPASATGTQRIRWRRLATVATGVACAVALAATVLVGEDPGANPRVRVVALPDAAPAATFDAETALLTHRDFDQLADTRDAALVRDLDFYAWYAAQLAATATGTPLVFPDAAEPASAQPATGSTHAPR
jgi:hypothetical protein